LASRLSRHGVVWSASTLGPRRRVYSGYADGSVVGVHYLGDSREVSVEMTDAWKPDAPGAEPLRFLVLIDESDVDLGQDGVQPGDIGQIPMDFPPVRVVYADGHRSTLR
jgi:hypothetical protein